MEKQPDIFDVILFEGSYSESIKYKGKLSFTLKSRTVEEVMKINMEVEAKDFKTQSASLDEQLFQHLSYALTSYNGNDWSSMLPAQRGEKIKKLPSPVMQILISEMTKFDKKVNDACQEGEENFSETPGQKQE